MTGDRISLDYSPGDRIVWLLYDSDQGTEQRNLFWLRDSFGIDDVREAIISTGWVEQQGGELRLRSDVRCEVLRDVVEAMLGYFELPGVPTAELVEIRSAVAAAEFESVQLLVETIPWFAFAWLDVVVRQDLAEEARSMRRIWGRSQAIIELAPHCRRRVAELVARYTSHAGIRGTASRLAPSIATRKAGGAEAGAG